MAIHTTMIDQRQKIEQMLETIPEENFGEVLNFLQYLLFRNKQTTTGLYHVVDTFEGIWQEYPIEEEDITQARREMWGSFGEQAL